MSDIKKHIVHSVADYITAISSIASEDRTPLWYRGHISANYRLLPSVLRYVKPKYDSRRNKIKKGQIVQSSGYSVIGISFEEMLDEFKRRAIGFIEREPKNDFEWMFIMQHYGVPTRLLDWTTNALVALYFALQKETKKPKHKKIERAGFVEEEFNETGYSDYGGAILIINPALLNKKTIEYERPIDTNKNYDEIEIYIRPGESNGGASLPISLLGRTRYRASCLTGST